MRELFPESLIDDDAVSVSESLPMREETLMLETKEADPEGQRFPTI